MRLLHSTFSDVGLILAAYHAVGITPTSELERGMLLE